MKKQNIVLFFFAIICIGCERTEPCPSVLSDLNYFPYIKGQSLKFINSQNDTLIYAITNEEIFDSGFATRGGGINSMGNYCTSMALFEINSTQDTAAMDCEIGVDGSLDKVWSFALRVYLRKNQYNNERLEIIPIQSKHSGKKVKYNEISNYVNDTLTLEDENNKIVKKVIIVKNKGIVSYTTADGEKWGLAE